MGLRKVLFIINKFAGTGYLPQLEDKIIDATRRNDAECILEFTRSAGHAVELARNAMASDVHAVVAVGGDGTMNEVARGLHGRNIPMGIIPRGSGNGLARHLGIPLTVAGALQNIFSGSLLSMDTFTLNDKLSLNVSGAGFDGHIANLFGGKTRCGLTGYATLTMREFLRFGEFDSIIKAGADEWKVRSFVLAVANSSQYGNNACIAPRASVTDGLLDLNILRKVPPYRFDFVYAFFNKTIDRSPYCEIKTLPDFTIETETDLPYHVDGEPCGTGRSFRAKVNPAALPIIVPNKTIAC